MTRLAGFVKFYFFSGNQQLFFLSITLMLTVVVHQSSYGQDTNRPFQMIRARLVNSRTGAPVVFAKVINKDLRAGVLSDSLGVFSMSARINDTLYIRSLSYYPTVIRVDDSLAWQIRIPRIALEEQAFELGSVDLYGLGTYQEFKYNFLHYQAPEDKSKKLQDDILKAIGKVPKHPLQPQASIPLGSPISALYNLFSKEGKALRRLEKAKLRDNVFLLTYQKYNRDIVAGITGLSGTLLDQFMVFSRPDDEFLLQANEYDLTHKILENYERFKKEVLENTKKQSPSKN
jgi:hypothetical protein